MRNHLTQLPIVRISTFFIALNLIYGTLTSTVLAAEAVIEEIIVTGSYIRRDNFDIIAPVSIISADDIAQSGALQLGELVADATYNYGSADTANRINGTGGVDTTFNLRGLGPRATLNLVDGRRGTVGEVNSSYPSIAIQRIEVLRDGASALYGTSAVAGVVNLIPIKDYDGLKFMVGYDTDDEDSAHQSLFTGIGGFSVGSTDFVAAFEYEDRGNIPLTDRPRYLRAGFHDSGAANPGNFSVPLRDAAGVLTGASAIRPDPGCGSDGSPTDQSLSINNTSGFIGPFRDCRLALGSTWDLQLALENLNLYSNVTTEISEYLKLEVQGIYNRREQLQRSSPVFPSGNATLLPVIVGEYPFNPFRALDASGNPLFAQDLDGNGLPDRDGSGVVILDPAGIPFNEDVRIARWRPFGKSGTLPHGVNADGASENRNPMHSDPRARDYLTLSAKLEYAFPESSWTGSAAITYLNGRSHFGSWGDSTSRLIDALLGAGGPNGDEYFNPFYATDPSRLNSQSVVNFIRVPSRTDSEFSQTVYDAVFSGDLFELPAGTLGAAFGVQYRDALFTTDPSADRLVGDTWGLQVEQALRISQDTSAVFGELSVPLIDGLEMQLAARYEDYGDGLDSTDPKIGLKYQPIDALSLRASWGTSFVAPNPFQLESPVICGSAGVQDKILGGSNTFVGRCSSGNPNLEAETADVWNAGFTWRINDDLTLLLDYVDIDFKDRHIFTSA
ncbi:MAG: TonB-dependent receptor [Pseudomonadales bacterium]|nr:TonB-dependent receptor [Pseudomonadales bacterium]